MATFVSQLADLQKELKCELKRVKMLFSRCNMCRDIYQRTDTNQYIYIESEMSYQDGVDDYFGWKYISDNQFVRLK